MTQRDAPPVSDAALRAATGRGWDEWLALLDGGNASGMSHAEIAALAGRHGAEPWWAQTVTVGYERARGLRRVHERPDGYGISVSRTLPVAVEDLFEAWAATERRAAWLHDPGMVVKKATPPKSIRIAWPEGGAVEVRFNARGPAKAQVVVDHRKLATQEEAAAMKEFWNRQLDVLAGTLR
jgi:hypothetical protein